MMAPNASFIAKTDITDHNKLKAPTIMVQNRSSASNVILVAKLAPIKGMIIALHAKLANL